MLDNRIGWNYYRVYSEIAGYFEARKDLKRADKVWRQGLEGIDKEK
jgi:hypothetical protein